MGQRGPPGRAHRHTLGFLRCEPLRMYCLLSKGTIIWQRVHTLKSDIHNITAKTVLEGSSVFDLLKGNVGGGGGQPEG